MNSNLATIKNKVIKTTLISSEWNGDTAPYTYKFTCSDIMSQNTNVLLEIPQYITDDERNAYKKARIESGEIDTGYVLLYSYGVKPSINIPVSFSVGGDY